MDNVFEINLSGAVSADAGGSEIGKVVVGGLASHCCFEVENTGEYALDAFKVQGRAISGGALVDLATTWTGTLSTLIVATSVNLTTLAKDAKGVAIVQCPGVHELVFWASADSTASEVTIKGLAVG